jgi:hypothetical protein
MDLIENVFELFVAVLNEWKGSGLLDDALVEILDFDFVAIAKPKAFIPVLCNSYNIVWFKRFHLSALTTDAYLLSTQSEVRKVLSYGAGGLYEVDFPTFCQVLNLMLRRLNFMYHAVHELWGNSILSPINNWRNVQVEAIKREFKQHEAAIEN